MWIHDLSYEWTINTAVWDSVNFVLLFHISVQKPMIINENLIMHIFYPYKVNSGGHKLGFNSKYKNEKYTKWYNIVHNID